MIQDTEIRPARYDDLDTISTLIRNTLLLSNGVDYDFRVVQYLSGQYSPDGVAEMARKREMYVYEHSGRIAGTISLGDNTIYGFFVAPDMQRRGIGTKLLKWVERRAREKGRRTLRVGASITAINFYRKHGYKTIRQEHDPTHGDVYFMEKLL